MATVSVVVPFFRAERFFQQMLDSVLVQEPPVAEIIVVLDGEDSDARAFLDGFDARRLRVDVLRRNGGPARARNRGAELATGDYLAFIDADDLWAATKLREQAAFMSRNPDFDACHTGVEVFSGDKVLARYTAKPERLRMQDLLKGNQVLTSSLLIRRSAFLAAGGFDPSYLTSEDFEFVIRLVRRGSRIGFLDAPLTRLRRSGHGNLSLNGPLLLRNHLRLAYHYRRDFLRAGGFGAYLRFIGKYLAEDGSRTPGLPGRLIYRCGLLLQNRIREPQTPRAERPGAS